MIAVTKPATSGSSPFDSSRICSGSCWSAYFRPNPGGNRYPSMQAIIADTLAAHIAVIRGLDALAADINRFAERAWACLADNGRVFWIGNGGSAADSQHLAAELVGRFERERPGLASMALTTDSSILTSVSNDYGFESVFARQVEALCRPGDLLVGLSTSGNSANVLRAMQRAADLGVYRVGLTGGTGGRLREHSDLCLVVPSENTARIQEAHILIGHLLCDLVERRAAAGR
jgi:D-sedoheptulose 7-phosphate isomerase